MPDARRAQAMLGKVKSRRPRRPNVSMVQTAGQAKMKLIRPNPHEPSRALVGDAPARTRMVEE